MPNEYLDDGAPADQTSMPAEDESPEQAEDKRDSEKTTLIPSSICPGMEFDVGDEIVLKVVAVHEDELEVAYAPDKEKEKDNEPSMSRASKDNETAMRGGGMNRYMED